MLSGADGGEVEAVNGVAEHAVFLELEVDHPPHLRAVARGGEEGLTWRGGERGKGGREGEK